MRYRTLSPECFVRKGQDLSSVAASEGYGQLCTALSSRPSVVSGATNINGGHVCIRATNPVTGPSSSVWLSPTHLSHVMWGRGVVEVL